MLDRKYFFLHLCDSFVHLLKILFIILYLGHHSYKEVCQEIIVQILQRLWAQTAKIFWVAQIWNNDSRLRLGVSEMFFETIDSILNTF